MPDASEIEMTAEPACAGLEIGAVSVKWVCREPDGGVSHQVIEHGGAPRAVVERLVAECALPLPARVVMTGQAAKVLFDLPYRSSTECLEAALASHGLQPDILLALGGETFSVYPMKDGRVRNVLSTSKCAAGTGEFIVQQLQRMGMSLEEGLQESLEGKRVPLATRCSVHCKSDATHMLNKGECTRGDIAASLIAALADHATQLVASAEWSSQTIVISGGVANNSLFVELFRARHPAAKVLVLAESHYLEAYGAALLARSLPAQAALSCWDLPGGCASVSFETLAPLSQAESLLDYRVEETPPTAALVDGGAYVLGLDAGSTTTKAVLLDAADGRVAASCYLRTLGNPVLATQRCLEQLIEQAGSVSIRIVQLATTGSGREMVSVFLGACLSVNEIVAHARAAAHYLPEVSSVFEIGGQDSKLISLSEAIPVDYAMNEGCSAGTGSFLEESASLDMGVATDQISAAATGSERPIAFGERCAAFINTDVRNALQQGASRQDVIAGLVYSIADNYISRVVGPRHLGEHVLFCGGVALNRSVALAIAARTGRQLMVPPRPELMGCIGAALEAADALRAGIRPEAPLALEQLAVADMRVTGSFRCKSCDNKCALKKISVGGHVYPFGGLCSKYDNLRRGRGEQREGRDLVAVRNKMMFEEYGPAPIDRPRGRIGLPLALTSFELFPLFSKLINALGYEVVTSDTGRSGAVRTGAAICYPCQIAHGAVENLLAQGVDFILLPRVLELNVPEGALHSYTCPSTTVIPDIVGGNVSGADAKILSPHIALSEHLVETSLLEIERLAPQLELEPSALREAGQAAIDHYRDFQRAYRQCASEQLDQIAGEPMVVLAGRPYSVYSSEVNLALPRKIASRGFHAVPADMLPAVEGALHQRDVWHFTQQISNAVAFVKARPSAHLCLVSCFSCGPDAVMYHAFRDALAGLTFCYLEIDSHTAHAGFETRVGAFLDIIDKRKRRAPSARPHSGDTAVTLARLSDGRDQIIDSDGNTVAYDDPRVVHVLTDITNPATAQLVRAVYDKADRTCRLAMSPSVEAMQLAKKVCSGRECVPLMSAAGAAVQDLGKRAPDEITFYLTLDQEGPCQNGAWPVVWEAFAGRLKARNVIGGVGRSPWNKQLGMHGSLVAEINRFVLLGDLLQEAKLTLTCLAQDEEAAQHVFEDELARLARGVREGAELQELLQRWAEQLSQAPLKMPVGEAPKVLVFGGLNVAYVHEPVSAYLCEQGVIPKVIDLAEGIASIASEGAMRCALRHGQVNAEDQLSFSPPRENRKERTLTRMSHYAVRLIESQLSTMREAMAGSGLLFDEPVALADVLSSGGPYVSNCGFTESVIAVGRYVSARQQGFYDGLVNLGCFNCQPAMNAQAIIRPLAAEADIPYVALDCEGPWISANQTRLLETLAVQAKRRRAAALMER